GAFQTRPTPKKDPLFRGGEMLAARAKPNPANPETRHKGLSSSPDFHEPIGLFQVLHSDKQLLRLTMNAIHQQFVVIGDLIALQARFSQPAQDTSFDGAKPQPVDQQSSGLPDDFVLEDEVLWLDGMCGKVRFQLEERMQPFTMACKNGRAVAENGEGGFLHL